MDKIFAVGFHRKQKSRKIGPGVWAVGVLGEVEMDAATIRHRLERGLAVPSRRPRHVTTK